MAGKGGTGKGGGVGCDALLLLAALACVSVCARGWGWLASSCGVHARLRAISEGIKEHSSSSFFLKLTGKAFSFRGYLIING